MRIKKAKAAQSSQRTVKSGERLSRFSSLTAPRALLSPENLNWSAKMPFSVFFPSECLNKRRFYSLKAMLHFVLDLYQVKQVLLF